jgi:hypothetical protein
MVAESPASAVGIASNGDSSAEDCVSQIPPWVDC